MIENLYRVGLDGIVGEKMGGIGFDEENDEKIVLNVKTPFYFNAINLMEKKNLYFV